MRILLLFLMGVAAALVMEEYLNYRYHGEDELEFLHIWKKKSRWMFLLGVIAIHAVECYLFTMYEYTLIKTIRYFALSWFLLLLAVIDAKQRILPNRILGIMMAVQVVLLSAESLTAGEYVADIWISALIGLGFTGIILVVVYLISRRSIGFGDVKLISCIGFYLGVYLVFAGLFLSSVFSAVYGGIAILRKKITMKDTFPMGPFLAAGMILTLLLGV